MDRYYNNPTKGRLSFDEMLQEIVSFIHDRESQYQILVGTDSRQGRTGAKFVTAIVVHRKTNGARYFYTTRYVSYTMSLRQRMLAEATFSLEEAMLIKEHLHGADCQCPSIEIHVDVGEHGATKVLINEVIGMVAGNFKTLYKPDSLAASSVADRHTQIYS